MRNRIMSLLVSTSVGLALSVIMVSMSAAQTASPQVPPSRDNTTTPDQSRQTPESASPSQATPPSAQSQQSPQQGSTQQGSTSSSGGQASTIDEELGLTPDQKQKIATVVDDENKQISAVRDDGSLSLEQKQQKVLQIRQAGTPRIKAILTPDQLQKLAAIQQRMRDQQQGSQQSAPQSQPQH